MKDLDKSDQEVLRLLSEGTTDHEICRSLGLSSKGLSRALNRISARAAVESDDIGRHYERALRKRAEFLNVSLAARLRALMDILPQAVLVIDGRTGAVKEFNQVACDLFGYTSDELRSVGVEELVPPEHRPIHPAYRLGFLSNARKRQMGYHPPIFGIRRDGREIEMAIALTATTTDDDVMVVCSELSKWQGDFEPVAPAEAPLP